MEIIPAWSGPTGLRSASPIDHELTADAQRLIDRAPAENTTRAHQMHGRWFREWCEETGRSPYPPVTTATFTNYVAHLTGLGVAPTTIRQAMAAIRTAHRKAHLELPATDDANEILKTYSRDRAARGVRVDHATPIVAETLRDLVAVCDLGTLTGLRDRVIVTLGVHLMGRRCELARLNLADVSETPEGLLAFVAYSKTDQRGTGRTVAIPRARKDETVCPMLAVRDWRAGIAKHGVTDGRLLRSINRWGKPGAALTGHSVNRIVKDLVLRAKLPDAEHYSAHSLRSGGATVAAKTGAPRPFIARHGGWTPGSAVLDGYVRQVDQWKDNPLLDAF